MRSVHSEQLGRWGKPRNGSCRGSRRVPSTTEGHVQCGARGRGALHPAGVLGQRHGANGHSRNLGGPLFSREDEPDGRPAGQVRDRRSTRLRCADREETAARSGTGERGRPEPAGKEERESDSLVVPRMSGNLARGTRRREGASWVNFHWRETWPNRRARVPRPLNCNGSQGWLGKTEASDSRISRIC